MKATDFRIGNICRDKLTGELLVVCDLVDKEIGFMPVSGKKLPDGWQAEPLFIEKFELRHLGFYEVSQNVFRHASEAMAVMFSIDRFFVAIMDDAGSSYRPHFEGFEFVHELQNIFKDLARKDLEPKLKP